MLRLCDGGVNLTQSACSWLWRVAETEFAAQGCAVTVILPAPAPFMTAVFTLSAASGV